MSWSSSSLSRQRAQAASFIEDSVSSDRLDVTNRTRTAEQAQASLAVTIKVIYAVAVFRRLLRNRQQRLGLPSSPPSPPLTPLGAEQPACPAIEWDELKMGRLLGQGAFCSAYSVNLSKQRQHEVFAAYPVDQDPSFQTCCKLLLPKHRHCKLATADLKREAVLLSHLCHVHVMGALCHGLTPQGDTFVVMPLLASTLTAALPRPMDEVGVLKHRAQVKAWPLVRAVRLAVQLGRALRYCHREAFPGCAVLHRDLKPDNVGLAPGGGDVILFDFGLAKITSPCEAGEPATQGGPKLTGQTGSLRYMAPEVALCEPYDERADVSTPSRSSCGKWRPAPCRLPGWRRWAASRASSSASRGRARARRCRPSGPRRCARPSRRAGRRRCLAARRSVRRCLRSRAFSSSSSSERPGPSQPALLGLRRGWPPCSAAAPPSRSHRPRCVRAVRHQANGFDLPSVW